MGICDRWLRRLIAAEIVTGVMNEIVTSEGISKMRIHRESFFVETRHRDEFVSITARVVEIVSRSGVVRGEATVFVPHTTAGVTINENADPDVVHDVLLTLRELFPQDRRGYQHAEGNSDSHIKAMMMGSSARLLVDQSKPILGTWQGVFFCEFDGPRRRQVHVQVLGE